MIKKLWKDNFELLSKASIGGISREDINDAVEMVITDRINPKVFISNFEVLISGFFNPFHFSGISKRHPSPSMTYCYKGKLISNFNSLKRAQAIPFWFYAAYPDVMEWFHKWQLEYDQPIEFDDHKIITETMKLFGAKKIDLERGSTFNKEKQCKPKYLKNLVKNYKNKTGKELEVAVKKFSEDDIYTGIEMLNVIGAESNFTLIAEITTKFYLELEKNYKDFFTDKVGLLATAGILDTQSYVFTDEIKTTEIIDIAKEAVKSGDSLLNFIIELEIKLLEFDNPDMNENFIREACKKQRRKIKDAIQKTKKEYKGEPRIIYDTRIFMNSNEFAQIREFLGVIIR